MPKEEFNKKYIRQFNTSGITNPTSHFYISRKKELGEAIAAVKGIPGEQGGRYFTMFASRQMGKTTFVEELVGKLDQEVYAPVVISFESVAKMSAEEFLTRFSEEIRTKSRTLKDEKVKSILGGIADFTKFLDFERFVKNITTQFDKKFVLVIDEFDGIAKSYMGDLLHTFREIYFHRGVHYNLHSLILIGVRNITDVNMDNASPFNTNDELPLPAFSKEQVFDLMHQYEEETGQLFAQEVKEAVFFNTQGQPGLTNALCKMLVEDFNPGKGQGIRLFNFNQMISHFLHSHISKNVVNVMNKAKRYRQEIMEIFETQNKMEFKIDTEWIGYLYINGAINYEEVTDSLTGQTFKYIKFANPIYQKKLYSYFKPDFAGEAARYFTPGESLDKFYRNHETGLDILLLIQNYQKYVNQRGNRAFAHALERADGRKYEAVYHYSLDAYLHSALDSLGGSTAVEFPTGNGKVDIFIFYKKYRYLIEIKNYRDEGQIKKAKRQVIDYAKTEGLKEVYLVIFTEVHPRDRLDVSSKEEIDHITLYSVLVNVNFETIS